MKNKMRVADYVASFLFSKNVRNIFMLTGYGAMYLNDAIKKKGLNTMRQETKLLHL